MERKSSFLQTALLFALSFVMLLPFESKAQTQTPPAAVTGRVLETGTNLPMPGVTIAVKGTTRKVYSDDNGRYSISAGPNDVLVFSFISMETTELKVNGRSVVNLTMIPKEEALGEVVVVGYNTVRKKDLTGSVSVVNVKDMSKAPVGSFAEALAGRVAGVQVSSNDGQPGGGVNIVIRGAGSLTNSVQPLYVIDGFPADDFDPSTLNPDDIESMTILKDASSTAIYGSRAANGVVLIQTKKGRIGKPVVSLGASSGFQTGRKEIELMSPYEYIRYQLERFPTSGEGWRYLAGGKTLDDYKGVEGVNFQDHVFTQGKINIYNLAIRGGNEQTKYSISGSFFDQQGVVINTGLKRYTGRMTLDHTISNRFRANFVAGYSDVTQWGQVISSTPTGNTSSYTMFRTWAYRPIGFPDSEESLLEEGADDDAVNNSDYRINPVLDLQNQYQYDYTGVLEGLASVSANITDDLILKVGGGIRKTNGTAERFYNSKTSKGSPSNPNNNEGINGSLAHNFINSWSSENTLTYNKTFNKKHTVAALGLVSLQKTVYKSDGFSSKLLPNESLGIAGLNEGVPYNPVASTSYNTRNSYGGRIDYNYDSRYLVTINFRADGSSKFAAHNRWGYFPGASAAWNMHNEAFLKNNAVISTSKLRGSYGKIGNDRVGDFSYISQLTTNISGYSFNNGTPLLAVYQNNLGNEDLTWETTTSMDVDYQLGLFKDRIELTAGVYKKTTDNLLLNAQLPPTVGFGTAYKNIGKMENKGFEFTLNARVIESKDFRWESSVNVTFNKNKVLALTEGQRSLDNSVVTDVNYTDNLYTATIGQSAGMMIGYIWEGNYQYSDFDSPAPGVYILKSEVPANGRPRNTILPGDIKYRDLNGDGNVNADDKTIIGRGLPIHYGGFVNNFSYKGFSLNVFFQWSYGNDIYNANRITFEGNTNGRRNMNQFASYANRWTPENQTNEHFRAGGEGVIGYHSTKYLEDGSYLRLKTVSLDYALPSRIIKRAYMTGLSLHVAMQNIFTWTKYTGLDPEVSTRNGVLTPGYDYSAYPQARTITFGLKANF